MTTFRKNRLVIAIFLSIFIFIYFPQWIGTIQKSTEQVKQNALPAYTLPVSGDDSYEYATLAKNMLENGVYSLSTTSPFAPETLRTPGYPIFVAGIYALTGNLFAVTFIQMILVVCIALLTYLLIFRITQNEFYAVIGGTLFMINPTVMMNTFILMTDILFTFLLLLFVFLIFSRLNLTKKSILLGILIGIMILVKPVVIYFLIFAPLLFTFYHASKETWRKVAGIACLMIVSSGFILSPWIIRNKVQTGAIGISSTTAWNVYWVLVPRFIMWQQGFDLKGSQYISIYKEHIEKYKLSSNDARKLENGPRAMHASNYILQHPFEYAWYHISQSKDFFIGPSFREATIFYGYWPDGHWLLKSERIFWFAVLILACSGFLSQFKNRRIIILGLIIFYFWILSGPISVPRYRIHIEPFLYTLASIGILYTKDRLRRAPFF